MNRLLFLVMVLLFYLQVSHSQPLIAPTTIVGGYHTVDLAAVGALQKSTLSNINAYAKVQLNLLGVVCLGDPTKIQTQIVSGTNYKLTYPTNKGSVTVTVYDQPWTKTRRITSTIPPMPLNFP